MEQAKITVRSKIVQNGLFEVYEDGRIFRFGKKRKTECPQFGTSRNGKYKAVSTTINGKQKNFYVHRLLAEAFVPNPYNKPHINHIDGNPSNNSVENLEWVTPKENISHAYEIGLIVRKKYNCLNCNEKTESTDKICPSCKIEKRTRENQKLVVQKIKDSVSHLPLELLTKRQREIVSKRLEGRTLQNIADELGVSRQAVDNHLKQAELRVSRKTGQTTYETDGLRKLIKLRNINSLNQSDVAKILEITTSSYSRKEMGKSEFKVSEAIKLSKLFNTSLDELFANETKEVI